MTQSNSSNPAVPKTPTTQRRSFLKAAAATGSVVTLSGPSILFAQDKSPIKVGILHSLSGTMAISESKDMFPTRWQSTIPLYQYPFAVCQRGYVIVPVLYVSDSLLDLRH